MPFLVLFYGLNACSVVRQVDQLPQDTYSFPAAIFQSRGPEGPLEKKRIKATLALTDSILPINPFIV